MEQDLILWMNTILIVIRLLFITVKIPGVRWYGDDAFDKWNAHDTEAYLNGDDSHGGYRVWYETISEQGHYETKVVQAAYDEQVWVQD